MGSQNYLRRHMSLTKLYVGNISFKATEDDLRELFSQAGEVQSVKLITDAATGRLRGFGFVEMTSDEDSEKAISMFNGKQFMDRSIVVNKAKPQEKRERSGGAGGGFRGKGFSGPRRTERR
jgi:RNA recognition motif-containing protein